MAVIKWNKAESERLINEIKEAPEKLQAKMRREYDAGDNYISRERIRKTQQKAKLTPKSDKIGKSYVRLIEQQMTVWMAILTSDTRNVEFTPMGGFNARETANNANKVAEFDYEAMNMFSVNIRWWWDIGETGLGVKTIQGWDSLEQRPLPSRIDPLATIPDPSNSIDSEMGFFGINAHMRAMEIHNNPTYFNTGELKLKGNQNEEAVTLNDALNDAGGYGKDMDMYQMTGIYHHFMWFEGHLYLTTWANERGLLIRIVEVEPKSEIQKKDISRVKIPITLARRKVIPGRYFGGSIYDDLEDSQDQLTILQNLMLKQARRESLGPDIIVNSSYVDPMSLTKRSAGGRVLTYKGAPKEILNPSNLVSTLQTPSGSLNGSDYAYNLVKREADAIVGGGDLSTGASPAGNQTKAEIQTLQKNINQLLSYSTTLITKSEKEFWLMWYESYVYNMSKTSKKYIVLTKGELIDSHEFKKDDFILDGPVLVSVKSKAQEEIKKQKKFSMYQVVANTVMPNLKPGSHNFNEFLRGICISGGFTHDEVMVYVPYSVDETKAMGGLTLLNNGHLPGAPKEGQDYKTYIDIFNLAKESKEKEEILLMYNQALVSSQLSIPEAGMEDPSQGGQVNAQTAGQIGQMAVQELSGVSSSPSIQDIAG